mmetsp:Transcript_142397/g.370924  ORF Transcript_142397/g.370924 Transcript_142397/m.370924 type:complete len:230 (+) Transcript_142397:1809-2498(+)
MRAGAAARRCRQGRLCAGSIEADRGGDQSGGGRHCTQGAMGNTPGETSGRRHGRRRVWRTAWQCRQGGSHPDQRSGGRREGTRGPRAAIAAATRFTGLGRVCGQGLPGDAGAGGRRWWQRPRLPFEGHIRPCHEGEGVRARGRPRRLTPSHLQEGETGRGGIRRDRGSAARAQSGASKLLQVGGVLADKLGARCGEWQGKAQLRQVDARPHSGVAGGLQGRRGQARRDT